MSSIARFPVAAVLGALMAGAMPLRAAKQQTAAVPAATLVVSGDVARLEVVRLHK